MVDLRSLEHRYPLGHRSKFEDLCTQLFRRRLGLTDGASAYRPPNQRGVESEPVEVGGRTYAYQVKYFDAETRLRDRKAELVRCVRDARKMGVTDLLIFVNKDKWVATGGEVPNEDPAYMREVEAAASEATPVKLEWWFKTGIEDALESRELRDIRDRFFGESRLAAYYDYVCNRFRDDNGSELYGEIPLRECYIEPTVEDDRGKPWSVRKYVELLVNGRGTIVIICGEPGHGKTSLCRKAVYDFRASGWLAGKVPNVLCFSLNPAGTKALSDGEFDLYALLGWGNNRRNPKHRIDEEDCRNALVFLDGFDELLEWRPGFDLRSFIEDHVLGFQADTRARVVITTRSMAVEPGKSSFDVYGDGRRLRVPILRMQPVSKGHQLEWIERCADYFRRLATDGSGSVGPATAEKASEAVAELGDYLPRYQQLHEDETLRVVLGVPIIFRMVVAARYVPKAGTSIVRIYDGLFYETWKRRRHDESGPAMEDAKAQLSRHALRVYLDEGDTAVVDDVLRSPWSFSFYTTNEGRSRVGFLHRSFYQYFLAHEIVDWFRVFAIDGNIVALRASLAYLARRRLDYTTLDYIRDIRDGDFCKNAMSKSFTMANRVIKETDGFLTNASARDDDGAVNAMSPLEQAHNVFWNIVSICSICGHEVTADRVNVRALRSYDLFGCVLSNLVLTSADLSQAQLSAARLQGANLSGTHFNGADLDGACLTGAYLVGAEFNMGDLSSANFSDANLSNACFLGTDLKFASFEDSNLEGADFRGANLVGAVLKGASLREASFGDLDFAGTYVSCASLRGVDFEGADLSGTQLAGVNLVGANLEGANLEGADLGEANLREAHLSGANLRGACLRGADLVWACLREANLEGADLFGAYLGEADLTGAIL